MQTTHFLFESLERLSAQVAFSVTSARRLVEVSWNTVDLSLPVMASALFRCDDEEREGGAALPGSAARGALLLEREGGARERFDGVRLSECPALVAEAFGVAAGAVVPRVAWRFTLEEGVARVGDAEGPALLERDVEYLHPEAGVVLARESEVRVELAREAPQALREALRALQHLPVVTKYWMAEYHYKRLLRWPTHNDLPGYEYEAKLSVHHLDVYALPAELAGRFEVIERYQTESVRWYLEGVELPGLGRLEKGRVGFRGSRASLVSKGKKQKLAGGVLKRTEEKSQGLDTWRLSALEPLALEMRRVKRQIYVLNRHNRRVYAVCLDHCEAEGRREPFIQLEIEYNGLLQIEPEEWGLSFEAQWRLARALEARAPRAALRCCERAALFARDVSAREVGAREVSAREVGAREVSAREVSAREVSAREVSAREVSAREAGAEAEALAALAALAERLRAETLTPPPAAEVDPALELQVVEEMNALSAALQRAYGFTPSEQTKRQWLAQPAPPALDAADGGRFER